MFYRSDTVVFGKPELVDAINRTIKSAALENVRGFEMFGGLREWVKINFCEGTVASILDYLQRTSLVINYIL